MAYKAKSTWWSETDAKYTGPTVKWDGVKLDASLQDLKDSVLWIDQKATMPALAFDCSTSSLQEKTLTGNGALTISNPVAGMVYTLIKKGAFTLTLPAGNRYANGNVTGTGETVITFLYDGTLFYFNFTAYTA